METKDYPKINKYSHGFVNEYFLTENVVRELNGNIEFKLKELNGIYIYNEEKKSLVVIFIQLQVK